MIKTVTKFVSKLSLIVLATFAPTAATFAASNNFKEFTNQLIDFVNLATSALLSAAIAFFFYSVVRNMWGFNSGNAEQKEKLQQTLVWGVLIIFIMVSIWGIIAILQQTLSSGLV